jgi:Flp pilus assembly protein TadB
LWATRASQVTQNSSLRSSRPRCKARAANPDYDAEEALAEEKTFQGFAVLIRWAILIVGGALLALFMEDRAVSVGVIVFIALAVLTEIWLWRRQSRRATQGES